ncbi:unnamed protein product [Cercopithifilaria johnstoni]|uniref:Uncharacterized protein n=1 Tax=Cercopithifilaria johnstoni TaxID=2874296 RepID=A0A8J2MAE8_9BILA|nr:unnamed protein product [Cercopithifilaria johnstoni]
MDTVAIQAVPQLIDMASCCSFPIILQEASSHHPASGTENIEMNGVDVIVQGTFRSGKSGSKQELIRSNDNGKRLSPSTDRRLTSESSRSPKEE